MSEETGELVLSREGSTEDQVVPETAPEPSELDKAHLSPEGMLERRRTAPHVYVFDLRDAEAFEAGHMPGSFNLPFAHLESNLHRLPFQGDLLFFDGGEGLARKAAEVLLENAFTDFYFMEEGYAVLMDTLANSPHDTRYAELDTEARAAAIERVLDEKVRAMLASDGGGMEVIGIEDERVLISYQGACGSCGSSTAGTLRFIQMALTNALNHEIEVVPVDM
jgi:Fe-S cluster biogenesis protein NfuA/rhodanese-related sulfurtransferase